MARRTPGDPEETPGLGIDGREWSVPVLEDGKDVGRYNVLLSVREESRCPLGETPRTWTEAELLNGVRSCVELELVTSQSPFESQLRLTAEALYGANRGAGYTVTLAKR